jgi:very-short-patch-repair endonuclease
MLRSKQMVVVGDAKQLPPTDFFSRAEVQTREGNLGDDEDDIEAESILEVCETTFRERRRLKWHYRSRCESLIAFSNRSFYGDTLITFPMAKPGSFSVELVRVDGTYRARCNPAEAARVAEEAIAFMRHFAEAPVDALPTLGIVSINAEQRDFIQEEIRRLATDDELVELYRERVEANGEPFFVKNLENVQGDERDHIFISMTFGKEHGAPSLAQNFGPINRKQGHRRLNVLFTRARIRIGLFTSFGSSDVRPTEQSSEGVHALKHYLEYAETRGRAIVRSVGGVSESDFETEVADRLRRRGYQIDLQVGVSGFRIDLGVRHPDHPERFLAGVECDGAAFHSSTSARDRDRLREEMLNSLGWDLVRVWSTDWFDNPDLETEKLARRLEELRKRPPSPFQSYRSLHNIEATIPVTEGDAAQVSANIMEPDVSDLEDEPSATAPIPGEHLLMSDTPLTLDEAARALEAFREQVIRPAMSDWEAHRSILRPAMIETFVQQRVAEPAAWYTHIPHYLRAGTNPAEKSRFLVAICDLIDRIEERSDLGDGRKTSDSGAKSPVVNGEYSAALSASSVVYIISDPSRVARPERDRFFDGAYAPALKDMIAHVVDTEGPIFEDVVVDRIARAHSLQRSGNQIRARVIALFPSGISRTKENGRNVVWPVGRDAKSIHPYRKDPTGRRQHADIPLQELAAIAVPFVRLRMGDEAVLYKMAEEFNLGRLREATRARFEAALRLARSTPDFGL